MTLGLGLSLDLGSDLGLGSGLDAGLGLSLGLDLDLDLGLGLVSGLDPGLGLSLGLDPGLGLSSLRFRYIQNVGAWIFFQSQKKIHFTVMPSKGAIIPKFEGEGKST